MTPSIHCLTLGAGGQGIEQHRGVGVSNQWAPMAASMPGHIGGSTPVFSSIIMLSADKIKYICAYSAISG